MKKIQDFLAGKKTYVNLFLSMGVGIAMSFGVVIPEWVLVILGTLTGITYKMGQNRSEALTKELLETIKTEIKDPAKPA